MDFENLDFFTKGEFSTVAIVVRRVSSGKHGANAPAPFGGECEALVADEAYMRTSPLFVTRKPTDSATSGFTELSGIFDENYQDFGEYSEGRKYCLQVQTTEAERLKKGDCLTIYGKNYAIVSFEPKQDGKLTSIVLKQDFS